MITQILAKVLPVLVMIALGRICATKGILNDDQHAGLKNIIGDILLPVVLFQAFFTAEYGRRMLLVFALVFAGYGAALAAGGEKMTPQFIVKNMLSNKACIGMLLGIVLGALGVHKAIDGTAAGEIVTSLLSFITAPTSALILIVMGYQLHVSRALLRPVLTTMGLRLGVLAVVCAAVSGILFAVIPFDKGLLLALMLQYTLPAPFIIPLFADLGDDAEYVSTTLSLGTVLAVVLFFFLAAFSLA